MFPYYLIYFYIIISIYLNSSKKHLKYSVLKIIFDPKCVFLLTFIFAALRGNGNGDYFNYLYGVKLVDSLNFIFSPKNYPFEFGFKVLSYFVNLVGLNPQFVLISMNAISFYSIYYVLKETKTNISLATFSFFPIVMLYDMHHSRSAVAMSLGMVFFVKLWKYDFEKWWRALFYFILGYSFHKSAVILLLFLPIVYFYKYKYNIGQFSIKEEMKRSVLILSLLIIISIAINPIELSMNIFNNTYTQYYYEKLSSYLSNPRWSYPFKLYDPRLGSTIIFYFSFYLLKNDVEIQKSDNAFNISVHKVYYLSLISLVIFSESTILAMRIYHLFNIIIVIYLPVLFHNKSFSKDKKYSLKIFLFLIYFVYTLALITQQVPYKLFFT